LAEALQIGVCFFGLKMIKQILEIKL